MCAAQSSKMGTVYKAVIYLIFGISAGLFGISQIHLDFGQTLLVDALFLIITVSVGFLYLRHLESSLGVSIFRRPRLELKLDTMNVNKVRESFYVISQQLAGTTFTIKSGEAYLLLTSLEDHPPHSVSMYLDYLRTKNGDHRANPSKSAECYVYFGEMIFVLSCGFFGGRIPFELLETSFKSEFSKRTIGFSQAFERRPH